MAAKQPQVKRRKRQKTLYSLQRGKWRIVADADCYILQRREPNKSYKNEGYYTKMSQLLTSYLEKEPRISTKDYPHALRDACDEARRVAMDIKEALTVEL